MNKNERDYRGSKSVLVTSTVKEQRVDGSYFGLNPKLRCTLMDFENSYLVNNLSKRLNNKQFSTLTLTPNYKLNPLVHLRNDKQMWFVSGLIDAEGTFYISIRKDNEYKLGWQIGAEFQIQLHKRDLNLLLQLQDFFGTGSVNISKTRHSVSYSVKSIKNITNIIIPQFLKYKLLTPLAYVRLRA